MRFSTRVKCVGVTTDHNYVERKLNVVKLGWCNVLLIFDGKRIKLYSHALDADLINASDLLFIETNFAEFCKCRLFKPLHDVIVTGKGAWCNIQKVVNQQNLMKLIKEINNLEESHVP